MKRTFDTNAKNFFRYSAVLSNAHYDMAEIYRIRHRNVGVAVVIATTLVGTTAFGSLAEGTDFPQKWAGWITLGAGTLSILATTLAALQTFLGFSDVQAQHKHGADGYSAVRRELELLLMKYPDVISVPDEEIVTELNAITKKLDDLDMASPTIPDAIYDAASAKTPEFS